MESLCLVLTKAVEAEDIFKHIRLYEEELSSDQYYDFSFTMVDNLLTYDCENAHIIAIIIDIITEYYECISFDYVDISELKVRKMIEVYLSSPEKNPQIMENCPRIVNLLQMSDKSFLAVLLKYGFNINIPGNSIFMKNFALDLLLKFLLRICDNDFSNQFWNDAHVLLEAIEHLSKNLRRSFLVILVLDALTRYIDGDEKAEDYVQCLQMYFEAIPDPHVSLQEVHNVLKVLTFYHPHIMYSFQSLCESFSEVMPVCVEYYQPRTLLHLARCKVRETITIQGHLPVSVNKLYLPNKVKEFILCKTDIKTQNY